MEIFQSSTWDLASEDMFKNLVDLEKKASDIVQVLSFDIIAIAQVAKRIVALKDETTDNFKKGISYLKGNFTNVCNSFINLGSGTTQK